MATADQLRRLREQESVFRNIYDAVAAQRESLAAEGRRPVLGGLLSKEPVRGTDTLRYEGIGNMLMGLLAPAAKAIDAPASAARQTIPRQDMAGEALGTAGMAMLGGGAVAKPAGSLGSNSVREVVKKYPDVEIDIYGNPQRGYELGKIKVPEGQRGSGLGTQVMDEIVAAADAEGARVSLTPDTSFGGTSVSRLKDFYKRFGFVENKGKNKDFSTRNTMYRDPLMANASKSAGALTVAADVAERGDTILNMLKSGQADNITDAMLDMGDSVKNTQLNQYLFQNYDLPMDEASRMARAQEMGFDDINYFHGSGNSNLLGFAQPKKGVGTKTIYGTSNPYTAGTYVSKPEGGVYPLMFRLDSDVPVVDNKGRTFKNINPYAIDETRGTMLSDRYAPEDIMRDTAFTQDLLVPEAEMDRVPSGIVDIHKKYYPADDGKVNVGYPTTTDHLALGMDDAGLKAIKFDNIVDRGPYGVRAYPQDSKNLTRQLTDEQVAEIKDFERNAMAAASYPATNVQLRDASLARSRFARFDPRLSHLSNLTAANMSPLGGLLAQGMVSQEEIEDYLRRAGMMQ